MPELGGDDGGETQFHGEPRQRSGPQFPKIFSPARDLPEVKVTGAAQRIFANQLRDVGRFRILVETVERRAKDNFSASSDRFRDPTFREHPQ